MTRKRSGKIKNTQIEPKVHLGGSKTVIKKRKKKIIKPKQRTKKYKKRGRNNSNSIKQILTLFTFGIISVLALYGLYKGIFWMIQLRSSKSQEVRGVTYVPGFDDLIAYPYSDNILLTYEDTPIIAQFLTTGRTVYRLHRNERIDKVFHFYNEELQGTEWSHVNSIPRTSHEMMYGEYYYNEQLGYGVRIYDRMNDIWYERLNKEETFSAKSEHVSKQNERSLVLSSNEGTPLLPDFPWQMSVPKEYLVRYFASEISDLRGVIFTEIKTGRESILEPISLLDNSLDDEQVERYIELLNNRISLENSDDQNENQHKTLSEWSIINTKYTEISGYYLLEATITNKETSPNVYILRNNRVNHAYALNLIDDDKDFMNFLFLNIRERQSDYDADAFKFDDR